MHLHLIVVIALMSVWWASLQNHQQQRQQNNCNYFLPGVFALASYRRGNVRVFQGDDDRVRVFVQLDENTTSSVGGNFELQSATSTVYNFDAGFQALAVTEQQLQEFRRQGGLFLEADRPREPAAQWEYYSGEELQRHFFKDETTRRKVNTDDGEDNEIGKEILDDLKMKNVPIFLNHSEIMDYYDNDNDNNNNDANTVDKKDEKNKDEFSPHKYNLRNNNNNNNKLKRLLQDANRQQLNKNLQLTQVLDAHKYTRGAGVKICVVDSGLQMPHVDLDPARFTGLQNLVPERGNNALTLPWDRDLLGHGTHVTGILSAKPDNGVGVIGIAPEADIVVVRVFRDNARVFEYSSGIVNAAYECIEKGGARIINLALAGTEAIESERMAFADMEQRFGVLVVASAGNFGPTARTRYPAGYPTVVSVGATSSDFLNETAAFSQANKQVNLVAPGVNILSTWLDDGFAFLRGTSMSCAHVSGIAALLWSFRPSATLSEIKAALYGSAMDLGAPGRDDFFGHGLVQAMDALILLNGGNSLDSGGNGKGNEPVPAPAPNPSTNNNGNGLMGEAQDGSPCIGNAMCRSRVCAQKDLTTQELVCCPLGFLSFLVNVPWSGVPQNVCGGQPVGSACDTNDMCTTRICINNECTNIRLPDLSPDCEEAQDCTSFNCGFKTTSIPQRVCCRQGGNVISTDVSFSSSVQPVCTRLQAGDSCSLGQMCDSRICIKGVCRSSRLPDLSRGCTQNTDCLSQSCAYPDTTTQQLFCCPIGTVASPQLVSWNPLPVNICGGSRTGNMPPGGPCGRNADCASGVCIVNTCAANEMADLGSCDDSLDCVNRVCARKESMASADMVCCSNGESYLEDVAWSSQDAEICGNLPAGAACDSNRVCQSTVCVLGRCQTGRQQDLAVCDDAQDCVNGQCALAESRQDAHLVCCTNGAVFREDVPWSTREVEICGNLAPGTTCGSNRVCQSAVCIRGKCQTGPVADLATCDDSDDCANRACARLESREEAPLVCCAQGVVFREDVSWAFLDFDVCGNLPLGAACDENRVCQSQVCIGGTCQQGAVADLMTCDDDFDCVSRACARNESMIDASMVCCQNGIKYREVVPWSIQSNDICGNLPSGATCDTNRECSGTSCVDRTCRP